MQYLCCIDTITVGYVFVSTLTTLKEEFKVRADTAPAAAVRSVV